MIDQIAYAVIKVYIKGVEGAPDCVTVKQSDTNVAALGGNFISMMKNRACNWARDGASYFADGSVDFMAVPATSIREIRVVFCDSYDRPVKVN